MDIVSRLILLLVALVSVPALAETTVHNGQTLYRVQPLYFHIQSNSAYQGASPSAVCTGADWLNAQTSTCRNGSYVASANGNDPGRCKITCSSGYTNTYTLNFSCPAGSVKIDSGAVNWGCWSPTDPTNCPANKELDSDTGTCECKTILGAGSFMVTGDTYQGCNAGCGMILRSGWYDKTANTTWGSWDQNGTACTAGEPSVLSANDPKVEAAKQCASGTCPGTVNGQSVCVPCDKSKQTQSTSSASTSSSTASGATSSTTTNETGSSSSQTSCANGSCTTTTTTTTVGPTGDKVDKTTTKTEPQSDYCTQNPKAAVCKGTESSWGGSCGSFSCDGDAVTCAIAQASWKSACALDIDETDPKVTAGQAAMSGGDRPGDHPGNSPEQNAFTANIDQSNPFSSECPADIPLDVMGQSIAIPLSHACDSLKFMGQIAVAFAMLGAAFIVFGGIKG